LFVRKYMHLLITLLLHVLVCIKSINYILKHLQYIKAQSYYILLHALLHALLHTHEKLRAFAAVLKLLLQVTCY
jgi:hypothetical protein